MPSGCYERKPVKKSVRKQISRTLKARKIANRTGRAVYPWHRWFGARRIQFTATQGSDFTCSIPSFVQMVRNEASKRGRSVNTQIFRKAVNVFFIKGD